MAPTALHATLEWVQGVIGMTGDVSDQQTWPLVERTLRLTVPVAALATLFGLVALAGYGLGVERLYRPIHNGPATNPLTALCIVAIGLGILGASLAGAQACCTRLFALLAMLLVSLRLLDAVFATRFAGFVTPFHGQVQLDLAVGKSNAMGINSSVMLLCIALALALALYALQKWSASQIMAFFSTTIPAVSLTGYVYGLEHFYGQMSLATTLSGMMLAVAMLAQTAPHGVVRAVLSPFIGGRIARLQAAIGYGTTTLAGYLLIGSKHFDQGYLFGVFVVFVSWFLILMVGISAFFQEYSDSQRRHWEQMLAHAAMNDALTDLPNRRRFFEFGRYEIERAKRIKSTLWVLIADLDHFKMVNDLAGHAMGDEVLKGVAAQLKSVVRNVDLVARIGGEEFGIILAGTPREGA
ncbi:MAG: GGDEF domain-containing protein, partial [Alcanivorax sp.]|nr:GGDEF domain-containing protein [Alcanivorax sp.]